MRTKHIRPHKSASGPHHPLAGYDRAWSLRWDHHGFANAERLAVVCVGRNGKRLFFHSFDAPPPHGSSDTTRFIYLPFLPTRGER